MLGAWIMTPEKECRMSVLTILKSMDERASRLEKEAADLREDAGQIRAILFGGATDDDPQPVKADPVASPPPPVASVTPPAPSAPKPPSVADIRAKAAEYNVNVDDLLPPGVMPSFAQKQQAAERIVKAKTAAESVKAIAEALNATKAEDQSDLTKLLASAD